MTQVSSQDSLVGLGEGPLLSVLTPLLPPSPGLGSELPSSAGLGTPASPWDTPRGFP